MTGDDARLDARLRRSLSALPVPDDLDTRSALRSVLDRSSRGKPDRSSATRRWGAPLAAAAAAVGVVVATVTVGALVTSGPDQTPPLGRPATDTLTGTWQRQVPASEAGLIGGRWTVTFAPNGVMALAGPAGAPSGDGASYSTDRRQMRVDAFVNNVCGELPAGTYEWRVTSGGLTLSLGDDPCRPRADLLAGTWKAVP